MTAEWRSESELSLKIRIVVEKLIEERNISVSPEDIEAEYAAIVERSGASIEDVKKYYDGNSQNKEYLLESIKEKKLYAQLFEKSAIQAGEQLSVEKLLGKETADAGTDV